MKFPIIKHISDILPVIEGRKEFVQNEKHGLVFVDYVLETNDTFSVNDDLESKLRRECRGIVFCSETGRLLARRLEKFFNYGQKDFGPEIFQGKFHVYEKMDGSMISPVWSKELNRYYWATRMGSPDFDLWVSDFVNRNLKYERLANLCLFNDLTPIFEYTSRNNIIVCNYPEETMTLLAIRNNRTGKYESRDKLEFKSEYYKIPLVKIHKGFSSFEQLEGFLESEDRANHEGFVVSNKTGYKKVKLKSQWYLKRHKIFSITGMHDRHAAIMVAEGCIDDARALIHSPIQMQRIDRIEKEVSSVLLKMYEIVKKESQNIINSNLTRKEYALGNPDQYARAFMFSNFENLESINHMNIAREIVLHHFQKDKDYDQFMEKMQDHI